MKSLVLAAFVTAAASVQAADSSFQEMTASVDARATALIPGSSEGATKFVSVRPSCAYVSHSLTVLDRQPPGSPDTRDNGVTSYGAELRRDRSGRVDAVTLMVLARVTPSLERASIGVRLTVVMRCELGSRVS